MEAKMQQTISIEEEIAHRHESMLVFQQKIAENKEKVETIQEECTALELEIEKVAILNEQARSQLAQIHREIRGASPSGGYLNHESKIFNFASRSMTILNVCDEINVCCKADLEDKTKEQLRRILLDLKKGNLSTNPHFKQYWAAQTLEWKKKFGHSFTPNEPWIKSGGVDVPTLKERITAYLILEE
jgi:hypothetical protein